MSSSRRADEPERKTGRRHVLSQLALGGVLALSGTLFVTSARVSGGTSIRDDSGDLAQLLRERDAEARDLGDEVARKRERVEDLTADASAADPAAAEHLEEVSLSAGLAAVHGPGLRVTLDDAPASALTSIDGVTADDLVVHQQDMESFVNALWSGGGEAMMLQDQRVIAGSAYRCAGNTLLLEGRVYSPPFVITVIGDPGAMQRAMDGSAGVRVYREWVDRAGLGLDVAVLEDVSLPAYDGSLTLETAEDAG